MRNLLRKMVASGDVLTSLVSGYYSVPFSVSCFDGCRLLRFYAFSSYATDLAGFLGNRSNRATGVIGIHIGVRRRRKPYAANLKASSHDVLVANPNWPICELVKPWRFPNSSATVAATFPREKTLFMSSEEFAPKRIKGCGTGATW